MSKVDLEKLKKLREETDVSYSLCRQALLEAGGDLEKARQILFRQGAKKVEKKKEKQTSEGRIFSYVHHNGKFAAMIELLSQTDFVANSKDFLELGSNIAMQAASMDFKSEQDLLKQEYIKDPSKTIETLINDTILKLGENIKLARAVRWVLGEK